MYAYSVMCTAVSEQQECAAIVLSAVMQQELPKVIDGGQDPLPEEPEVLEEEFDLSDIMGEELDAEVGTKEDRLRQLAEQVRSLFMSGRNVNMLTKAALNQAVSWQEGKTDWL